MMDIRGFGVQLRIRGTCDIMEHMINRSITNAIKEASQKIGVISLMGPRQSGKTTLTKTLFPQYAYYNLEDIRLRERVMADPHTFLNEHMHGVIIDEVQKYPEILSYIQVSIDEHYSPARFVITGSENLLLSEKVSQSLAGRVAIFELLPLSIEELSNHQLLHNVYEQLLYGFYPRLYDQKLRPADIYPDYISTYVERDIRQIKNIGNLSNFQRFLQLAAGRVGQLLNVSGLASDVGVDYKTIDSWISILEATYITVRLQPYYENYGKRIIKSSKLYFYDTGLLCYLLGIDTIDELKNHFAIGSIFENMVVSDLYKQIKNIKSSSHLYFWRDREGSEVDSIIKNGQDVYPVEIKLGSSFSADYIKGIYTWHTLAEQNHTGTIVYTGNNMNIQNIEFVNWQNMNKLKKYITSEA